MKKIKFIAIISVFLFAVSCKNEVDVIKIGVILPITGNLSFMGEQERNGMLLAQEEINSNGKNIKLFIEDSKSNARDGVSAANKLINFDKVDVLITSTTGVSLAVLPVAEGRNIDLIAYCQDPDIAGKSPYVTRLYLGLDDEAKAFVDYLRNLSDKRVGILYNKVEAWEKVVNFMLEPAIINNNNKLVYREDYPVGEQDLRNHVTKLKSTNAELLILLSYGFEFPSLFPLLIEKNIMQNTTIMGGWGFLYPNINHSWLEGILVSGPPYVFEKDALANEFSIRYSKKYGKTPNYDAAMSYNVIEFISRFFDKEKIINGIRFKDIIEGVEIENSVVGPYSIDNSGAMIIDAKLGIYKDGIITSRY